MGRFHDSRFPGEDDAYRAARDELLEAEIELRRQIERVAAQRRELPPGGTIPEDYAFESEDGPAKMSGLFAGGKDSLVIYSFMFGPDDDNPCPMCTSLLDGLDGEAPHIDDRVNLAVVARAPLAKIRAWADQRGWGHLKLLSSAGNRYNNDYFAEDDQGRQWPMINVFQRIGGGIRHTWGSEMFLAPADEGLHNRHADLIWPLWNMFDLTPAGRGTDWYPRYSYD